MASKAATVAGMFLQDRPITMVIVSTPLNEGETAAKIRQILACQSMGKP